MDGFLKVFNLINYLDYRPKFDQEKCIKRLSPKASCSKCKDICPIDAISLNKRSITINDNCDTCNLCVSQCPTNALIDTGKRFISHRDKIFVLCEKHTSDEETDPHLRISCLNFINTKILLNLYRRGFREIYTSTNMCTDCDKSNNIEKELEKANKILNKLNKPTISLINNEVDSIKELVNNAKEVKSKTEIDRRGFIKHLAKEFYSTAYELSPPAVREQFWDTETDIINMWQKDEEEKIALYRVDKNESRCIECHACVKLCPQKVWTIEDDIKEESTYLCNGCKLCSDTCPGKAIEITEDLHMTSRKIFEKLSKICTKCNKEFDTYKESVDVCSSCLGKDLFR